MKIRNTSSLFSLKSFTTVIIYFHLKLRHRRCIDRSVTTLHNVRRVNILSKYCPLFFIYCIQLKIGIILQDAAILISFSKEDNSSFDFIDVEKNWKTSSDNGGLPQANIGGHKLLPPVLYKQLCGQESRVFLYLYLVVARIK